MVKPVTSQPMRGVTVDLEAVEAVVLPVVVEAVTQEETRGQPTAQMEKAVTRFWIPVGRFLRFRWLGRDITQVRDLS